MNFIQLNIENRVGILEKVTNVLTRNRVHLQQLTFHTEATQTFSQVRISADLSVEEAEKLEKQFHRIFEVKSVELSNIEQITNN